jgi:hypothetical protein
MYHPCLQNFTKTRLPFIEYIFKGSNIFTRNHFNANVPRSQLSK